MQNPWINLSDTSPFVLEVDREALNVFNSRVGSEHLLHTELLPEPYLGSPSAPLVLLNLNPGFSSTDADYYNPGSYLAISNQENLQHTRKDYFFYLLDPHNSDFGGSKWWVRKLSPLLERFDAKQLATNILCVEYFPYHSKRFHYKARVPSQEYSFYLVRQAIKRQALIVLMRSKKIWLDAVPELQTYTRLYQLKNPQNPVISLRNCPEGFPEIVKVLDS